MSVSRVLHIQRVSVWIRESMQSVNWHVSPFLEIPEPHKLLKLGFVDIKRSMTLHHHGLFLSSDLFVCVCGFIVLNLSHTKLTSDQD